METIQSIAWRPFAIPFRAEHRVAHGVQRVREGVIVRVRTTQGRTGIGEASPLPSFGGGSAAGAMAELRRVAPLIVRRDLDEASEVATITAVSPDELATAFALETAFWALMAEEEGLPLWAMMGVVPGEPFEPAPPVPVNGLVDAVPPEQAARRAEALVDAGFRTIKVKVGAGEGVETDLARVAAVRAAAPGVRLRADANGGWSRREAEEVLRGLAPLGLELIEQPLAAGPGAIDRIARLARGASPILIFLDESYRGREDLEAIRRHPSIAGVVLKPMLLGLTASAYAPEELDEVGLEAVLTTTLDAGPATAAAIHLAALLPEPRRACGLASLDLLEDDLIREAPMIKNGEIEVPHRPGLGVELDEAALERYAAGPWREVRA